MEDLSQGRLVTDNRRCIICATILIVASCDFNFLRGPSIPQAWYYRKWHVYLQCGGDSRSVLVLSRALAKTSSFAHTLAQTSLQQDPLSSLLQGSFLEASLCRRLCARVQPKAPHISLSRQTPDVVHSGATLTSLSPQGLAELFQTCKLALVVKVVPKCVVPRCRLASTPRVQRNSHLQNTSGIQLRRTICDANARVHGKPNS